jgi:hypothetical protein
MFGRQTFRSGVAAVEFAIVAPLFFLLTLGLVEAGRMVMLQHALTNAAREGCRVAGLASSVDTAAVDSHVRAYLYSVVGRTALDATKVRINAPDTLRDVPSGTDMVVSVELGYADATWLPLQLLGLDPPISAEARHKRECAQPGVMTCETADEFCGPVVTFGAAVSRLWKPPSCYR